jgi:hypothetical protein
VEGLIRSLKVWKGERGTNRFHSLILLREEGLAWGAHRAAASASCYEIRSPSSWRAGAKQASEAEEGEREERGHLHRIEATSARNEKAFLRSERSSREPESTV